MKWILMAFVIYLLSYGVYYLVTWSDKPGRKVTKDHQPYLIFGVFRMANKSDITRMKPLSSETTYDIENQEAKRIARIQKYQTAYIYLTEARKRFEILQEYFIC